MLNNLALTLHNRMSANGVDAPSVPVIEYALKIVANTISIFGLSMLTGILTGEAWRTFLMLIVFSALRYISGGYHLKSASSTMR